MIVTKDLTKWFGRVRAVDSISFEIGRGEVVGFLGPNGAGKTTTIRMISGYLPPTAGTIHIAGRNVAEHQREVRRNIGYLPESAPLYTEMRVREYLAFRARLFGIARKDRPRMIDRALERCWITDVARRPIYQLSKGYRQRVGLAATLLHEPQVIILDEPTVGLDPSQIREVRGLIRQLAGDHTILYSTHILPEVELTCDRILLIARGRIQAEGTIDELRMQAAKSGRYIIESNVPDPIKHIRGIKDVVDVEVHRMDGQWQRIVVTAREHAPDLREVLAAMLIEAGGTIREITRSGASLEHLFIQTASDSNQAGAPGVSETSESDRPSDGDHHTASEEREITV